MDGHCHHIGQQYQDAKADSAVLSQTIPDRSGGVL
jgi:hypothetical protein